MLSHCLVCKKNTENKDSKIVKTENNRPMLLSRCTICGNKKSKFIRKQEPQGLLSDLRIKTPLSKVPLFNLLL